LVNVLFQHLSNPGVSMVTKCSILWIAIFKNALLFLEIQQKRAENSAFYIFHNHICIWIKFPVIERTCYAI